MTIFVMRKNQKVKAERLPFGYIYILSTKEIVPCHTACVERQAKDDLLYKLRLKQSVLVYNYKTNECKILKKGFILHIEFGWKNESQVILYAKQGWLVVYDREVFQKLPVRQILMVLVNSDNTVIRENVDTESRPIGILRGGSVLLIEDKELSWSTTDPIQLKIFNYQGYISKQAVSLLGYADSFTRQYWVMPYVEKIPYITTEAKICILCDNALRNCVLVHADRVGHMICCSGCAEKLSVNQESCPVCRSAITDIINVYH